MVSYSELLQTRQVEQTRSEFGVHTVDSYLAPPHADVQFEQPRFELWEHGVVSYVPEPHGPLHDEHEVSLVPPQPPVLKVPPGQVEHPVHSVFALVEQLPDSYVPDPHDEQGSQRVFDEPPQPATKYVPPPQGVHGLQLLPDMYPQQEQPPALQLSQLESQLNPKKLQAPSQSPAPTPPEHHEPPGR